MDQVGVRELRQNLSVDLRRVTEKHHTLDVANRSRPVALLTPLPATTDPIAAIEALGLTVQRETRDHRTLPPPAPARPGVSLSEIILTDRDA
jgi:antitoxin (DNA-binding transcriptional repressor) of toxin-antitoxin stability system